MILGRLPSVQKADNFLNLISCTLQPKTIFGITTSKKKKPENKHTLSHFMCTKTNRQTIFFSLCESVEPETIILKLNTVHFIHICSLYLLKLNYFHLSISIRKDLMLKKCEEKKKNSHHNQRLCAYRYYTGDKLFRKFVCSP